ncbi:response regulator transcription factor [Allokutzneria sp. A3M-2-11 16]|uniref:response regulator transcription factor n=1 Tax=Allokutzneria sp. A3M-2-11 16 TaxID=2962043 RepID=UPI0020B74D24|nr:response regulator transcription factor [Allokutzneria sp. A3M-2-11 16]MCP3803554.1 response regulator transcription factor [Allokutzneria sp. A3M-2-11 16]
MTRARVRLAVIDTEPTFAKGLEMLSSAPDAPIDLVASTDAASAAVWLVREARPDVVVVDLGLAPPGALSAITAIRRRAPSLAVAATTARNDRGLVTQALRAGASGVLPRSCAPDVLVQGLLALAHGWLLLPREIAPLPAPGTPRLNTSELRLWRYLAEDRSTTEIAVALSVSPRTVKRMTAALLRRLGVRSRTQAAALAGRDGLLDG